MGGVNLNRQRTGPRVELRTLQCSEEGEGGSNGEGGATVGNEEGRLWMEETVRRGCWMAKREVGLNFIVVFWGFASVLM